MRLIQMPCQIVRSGRRLIYRLLSWNPWQGVFLRLVSGCTVAGCVERGELLKSGSGCPDPCGPSSTERGRRMMGKKWAGTGAGPPGGRKHVSLFLNISILYP